MQMPGSGIIRKPGLDKGDTAGCVARFKIAVDTLVSGVSIAPIAGERTLDQPGADGYLASFNVGPAQIAEKPPIIAPERRQFLQQRQLCLVMVDPPTEAEQPKNAKRERQLQSIPRIFQRMRAHRS